MHLAVLHDLPSLYAKLRAYLRPAECIAAWLHAGAKRRKRAPNARASR